MTGLTEGAARASVPADAGFRQSPGRWWMDVCEMLREQADFRPLLTALVRRDLSVRYRNAAMGFGWAVAMPALYTFLFWIIFTRVAPIDTGMAYPVYAYTGLLGWNLIASSLRFSATSLTSNPNLVTKVYFAREVMPFSAVVVALFDFAVASVVLVGLMIFYQVPVTWTVLFLPVVLAIHVLFTAGFALLAAMTNLFYSDTKYILELLLTAGMFATSVVLPVERVGGTIGAVLRWNPVTHILEAYRDVLVRGTLPDIVGLGATALVSVMILIVSWTIFHRSEFRFAEEV